MDHIGCAHEQSRHGTSDILRPRRANISPVNGWPPRSARSANGPRCRPAPSHEGCFRWVCSGHRESSPKVIAYPLRGWLPQGDLSVRTFPVAPRLAFVLCRVIRARRRLSCLAVPAALPPFTKDSRNAPAIERWQRPTASRGAMCSASMRRAGHHRRSRTVSSVPGGRIAASGDDGREWGQ